MATIQALQSKLLTSARGQPSFTWVAAFFDTGDLNLDLRAKFMNCIIDDSLHVITANDDEVDFDETCAPRFGANRLQYLHITGELEYRTVVWTDHGIDIKWGSERLRSLMNTLNWPKALDQLRVAVQLYNSDYPDITQEWFDKTLIGADVLKVWVVWQLMFPDTPMRTFNLQLAWYLLTAPVQDDFLLVRADAYVAACPWEEVVEQVYPGLLKTDPGRFFVLAAHIAAVEGALLLHMRPVSHADDYLTLDDLRTAIEKVFVHDVALKSVLLGVI